MNQMPIFSKVIIDEITVRKKRDPAILDREELFLQSQNEEVIVREEFCSPDFKSVS